MPTLRAAEYGWLPGRLPGDPHFGRPVSPALSGRLVAAASRMLGWADAAGASLDALGPGRGPAGSYALNRGRDSWFFRVSSRHGHPKLEWDLLRFLASAGLPVNVPVSPPGILKANGRDYRIELRPLLVGKVFSGSSAELVRLAAVVAELHLALRRWPGRSRVRRIATARYRTLEAARLNVAAELRRGKTGLWRERSGWARRRLRPLLALLDEAPLRLDQQPGAQCLHGEVHTGNVLFIRHRPVLLDFEESVRHFAPPAWDFGFIAQRFAAAPGLPSAECRRRIRILERHGGLGPRQLAAAMRDICRYSLAVLACQRIEERVLAPVAEYEKFLRFAAAAHKLEAA